VSLEEMLLRGELSREPANPAEIRRLVDATTEASKLLEHLRAWLDVRADEP